LFSAPLRLAGTLQRTTAYTTIRHPADITLPAGNPTDAALLTPETQDEIRSGAFSKGLVQWLPRAVRSGDRVLVIGAGLGIASTLIARMKGVQRLILADPDPAASAYAEQVHDLNDVRGIETLTAVLSPGGSGKIHYIHGTPVDAPRRPAMAPLVNLNLILGEERISLLVLDTPSLPTQMFAGADLDHVDRVLLNCRNDLSLCWRAGGVCEQLFAHGFSPEPSDSAILFRRSAAWKRGRDAGSASGSANPWWMGKR
jgi:hypothetical protein